MKDSNLVLLDAVLNEVESRVNMFCPGVMFRILGKSLSAPIVDVERDEGGGNKIEFPEKVPEP
jgi:hypothetical protein